MAREAVVREIKTDLTADREIVQAMINEAGQYARDHQIIDAVIVLVERSGGSYIAIGDQPTKTMLAELDFAKHRIITSFDLDD